MLAWRIAKKQYALDRTGIGARTYGGRWNTPGVAVIYAGMTPEISAMETLVHAGDILPVDLVLVRLDLPEDANLYHRCLVADLPWMGRSSRICGRSRVRQYIHQCRHTPWNDRSVSSNA